MGTENMFNLFVWVRVYEYELKHGGKLVDFGEGHQLENQGQFLVSCQLGSV